MLLRFGTDFCRFRIIYKELINNVLGKRGFEMGHRGSMFTGNSERGYWYVEDYYTYYVDEDDDADEQYYAFCMMEEDSMKNGLEQCENW